MAAAVDSESGFGAGQTSASTSWKERQAWRRSRKRCLLALVQMLGRVRVICQCVDVTTDRTGCSVAPALGSPWTSLCGQPFSQRASANTGSPNENAISTSYYLPSFVGSVSKRKKTRLNVRDQHDPGCPIRQYFAQENSVWHRQSGGCPPIPYLSHVNLFPTQSYINMTSRIPRSLTSLGSRRLFCTTFACRQQPQQQQPAAGSSKDPSHPNLWYHPSPSIRGTALSFLPTQPVRGSRTILGHLPLGGGLEDFREEPGFL